MVYDDVYKNTRSAISEYTMQEDQGDVLTNIARTSKAHIKELALLHFDVFSDIKLSDTVRSKVFNLILGFRKIIFCY